MVGEDNPGLEGWNSRESDLTVSLRLDFEEPTTFGSLPDQDGGSRGTCGDEEGEDSDSDNVRRDPYIL